MMAKKEVTGQQLKVFISYSRRDLASADGIVEALERDGFQVLIDRRDLPYGEEWQKELGDFIRESDTVLWLVSPDSVRSDWCNWELGLVGELKKRLIPVKVRDTELAELPKAIGKIHLLPAEGVFTLQEHLAALVRVLNTDRTWLKEATRLADRARQWTAKNRDEGLLLRGAALRDAEAWERRQPANAPAPATETLELILGSRQAATRRQRYWVSGSLAVAAAAIGLAFYAYAQQTIAEQNEKEANLNNAKAQLQLALIRAERDEDLGAIQATLAGVEAAEKAGKPPEAFELQLYEVSSRIAAGLKLSAKLPFDEEGMYARKVFFVAEREVVCVTWSNDDGQKVKPYCLEFTNNRLKPLESATLGNPNITKELVGLAVKYEQSIPKLYETQENGGGLYYDASNLQFQNHDIGKIDSAFRCPGTDLAVVGLGTQSDKDPDSGAYFAVNVASNAVTALDEFDISYERACSPDGKYLVSQGGYYGPLKIHSATEDRLAHETTAELSRFGAEVTGVAFSDGGVALIPSLRLIGGLTTNPTLVSLDNQEDWETIEIPGWKGADGGAAAISRDNKLAAIVYSEKGGSTLTIWELSRLGVSQPAEDKETSLDDEKAEERVNLSSKTIEEGILALRHSLGGDSSFCIPDQPSGDVAIAVSRTRLVGFSISKKKTLWDRPAQFLTYPYAEDCESADRNDFGFFELKVIEIPGQKLSALCGLVATGASKCQFFADAVMPDWLRTFPVSTGCYVAYQSDSLWLCGLRGLKSEKSSAALAIIDWSTQRWEVLQDPYFSLMFEHQYVFAHFSVGELNACGRAHLSYSNWWRGGGAPQPKGAIILDVMNRKIVAHIRDSNHPIFCNAEELISNLRDQSKIFDPIALGSK